MNTFTPDAVADQDFYSAAALDSQRRLVANCGHHHRTREAAERCAVKLVELLSEPVRDLPRWRA